MAGRDDADRDGAAAGRDAAPTRRILLHLGVQKTGSTAFHHLLMRNADALADRLVLRTPHEGTPMRPLGRAAVAYALHPDKDSERRLTDAATLVREELPDDHRTVLISHENLAGAMPGNGGETRLFPALPGIVAVLDRVFKRIGRPEFVVCTRDLASWRPSVWAQAVRTDGYAGDYDRFLAETGDLPGWDDLAARLCDQVGGARLHLLRYEDQPDSSRPWSQILALAGIDDAGLAALEPVVARPMARLPEGATEFLRRLNALNLNPHPRDRVADLVAGSAHLFAAGPTAPRGTARD